MGNSTASDVTPGFDGLFSAAARQDPHPTYHRLRATAPIARVEADDDWILTRFADCEAALRDPRWSVDPALRGGRGGDDNDGGFLGGVGMSEFPIMLLLDPPDHTRLRRLVSKAFTPRTVERLRPRVTEILTSMLEPLRGAGPFDLMSEIAYPLPVTVICELLGVPVADRDGFAGWSSDAARLLDGHLDEDAVNAGVAALMHFMAYFDDLFAERRARPGDDLISQLVAVEDEGDVLTEMELRATTILLFVAGHETTMNLIGNGLVALLRHPDQLARLSADPSLAAGAVEECLRYDGPVHLSGRVASEPIELGGHQFDTHDEVTLLLAAANRDPAHCDDPDRFDITRTDNRHLTFSHGLHYCLGAALARLEGQVVFSTLAGPSSQLELVTAKPTYRDHLVLRGFDHLEISVG